MVSGVILVFGEVLDCIEVPWLISRTVFSSKSLQSGVVSALHNPSDKVKFYYQLEDIVTHVH
jgi:hypothetical protein